METIRIKKASPGKEYTFNADYFNDELSISVMNFRVFIDKNNGGIQIYLPNDYGTKWSYEDRIPWKSVRKSINDRVKDILKSQNRNESSQDSHYKKEQKPIPHIKVNLYDFEEDSCKANIILPYSKFRISGFNVTYSRVHGVQVNLPSHLYKWEYDKEISWKTVIKEIQTSYLADKSEQERALNMSNKIQSKFYSQNVTNIIDFDLSDESENKHLQGIIRDDKNLGVILVEFDDSEKIDDLSYFANIVKNKYLNIQNETKYKIQFEKLEDELTYLVDFKFPKKTHLYSGYEICENIHGEITVRDPKGKIWTESRNKQLLSDLIRAEYRIFKRNVLPPQKDFEFKDFLEEYTKNMKKNLNNELGRVKNSKSGSFLFRERSIIVQDKKRNGAKISEIANEINNQNIGVFEVEILAWISKLQIVNRAMILDLILCGNISIGDRNGIKGDKVSDKLKSLERLDLIEILKYAVLDESGESFEINSNMNIYSLGFNGFNLLNSIGRKAGKRNPYIVLTDGNTVKKRLSCNQWLVYWLSHYMEKDIHDYFIDKTINLIGNNYNSAKIYASVNIGNRTFVCECIRRCEDFLEESNKKELIEKFQRLSNIFDDIENIYMRAGVIRKKVNFMIRPIIQYICEDEEHMIEMMYFFKTYLQLNPEQEVWFTCDGRVYDYDCRGKRFVHFVNGNKENVNLFEEVGVAEITMEEKGQKGI